MNVSSENFLYTYICGLSEVFNFSSNISPEGLTVGGDVGRWSETFGFFQLSDSELTRGQSLCSLLSPQDWWIGGEMRLWALSDRFPSTKPFQHCWKCSVDNSTASCLFCFFCDLIFERSLAMRKTCGRLLVNLSGPLGLPPVSGWWGFTENRLTHSLVPLVVDQGKTNQSSYNSYTFIIYILVMAHSCHQPFGLAVSCLYHKITEWPWKPTCLWHNSNQSLESNESF